MNGVSNTTRHGFPFPLRRVTSNLATAEKGRSAVARMFVIAIVMFLGLFLPTYAYAATYGGWTEAGGGTIAYGAAQGAVHPLQISWSAGTVSGNNNYLRFVVQCDDGWHYGGVYTNYSGAYSAGSYNGFSVSDTVCSGMSAGTWRATGIAFTSFSNFSIGAGGATASNTLISSANQGALLDAINAPGYTPGPSPAPTGTGNACTLSDTALVRLARGAGFTETTIQTAVAISLAESGGKVNALHYNSSTDSYDIGLWQINDVAHSTYDRNLLYTSPSYNASKAQAVYAVSNVWTPWTTYNSGAYNKYMSRAATALQNAPTGVLTGSKCSDFTASDTVATTADSPKTSTNAPDIGQSYTATITFTANMQIAVSWLAGEVLDTAPVLRTVFKCGSGTTSAWYFGDPWTTIPVPPQSSAPYAAGSHTFDSHNCPDGKTPTMAGFAETTTSAYSLDAGGATASNTFITGQWELLGYAVYPSATSTDTPADDDPNCTFTFNVFKILKCAFIPSSQDSARYSSRINSIKGNPPVSTIIGSVTFITDAVDIGRACGGTCPADNIPYATTQDNGAAISTAVNNGLPAYSFNPIQETGDWIQGTSRNGNTHSGALHTLGATLYLMAQIVIWAGVLWFIYNQITGSIGARE